MKLEGLRFTGENYTQVCLLDPAKLRLVEKHIGPGNFERHIEHSEIGDPLRIGDWAVKLGDGPVVFMTERALRHIVGPLIETYCSWKPL